MRLTPDPGLRRPATSADLERTLTRGRRLRQRRRVRHALVVGAALCVAAGTLVGEAGLPAKHRPAQLAETLRDGTPSPGPSPTPAAAHTLSTPPSALISSGIPAVVDVHSFSFVSSRTGFVLASGQYCSQASCTFLLSTRDAGRTWRRLAELSSGLGFDASAAGDIAFVNAQDGYAWGPQLWATHDGGASWRQVDLFGGAVVSLAAGGGRVYALIAPPCRGPVTSCQPGYLAAGTASSGPATRVPGFSFYDTGQLGLDTITVHGASVWVVATLGGRAQPAGPSFFASSDGRHFAPRATPCTDDTFAFDLAAADTKHLTGVCGGEPGAGHQPRHAYTSGDAGRSWRQVSDPAQASGSKLAATEHAVFLVDRDAVEVTRDGGQTWTSAYEDGGGGGGGTFGFVNDDLGFFVSFSQLLVTRDAGRTWRAVDFHSRQ